MRLSTRLRSSKIILPWLTGAIAEYEVVTVFPLICPSDKFTLERRALILCLQYACPSDGKPLSQMPGSYRHQGMIQAKCIQSSKSEGIDLFHL